MHKDVKEILITNEEIKEKIRELGVLLSEEYKDKYPLFIGILNGSAPFMMELILNMNIDVEYEFMDVSSYQGIESKQLKINKDIDRPVTKRHIVIVEDIIDTGRTLQAVKKLFEHRDAASVKVVALLDKKECRLVDMEADYIGYEIPDAFVIGYGLDYDGKYRNLNYIGVLDEKVYE